MNDSGAFKGLFYCTTTLFELGTVQVIHMSNDTFFALTKKKKSPVGLTFFHESLNQAQTFFLSFFFLSFFLSFFQ